MSIPKKLQGKVIHAGDGKRCVICGQVMTKGSGDSKSTTDHVMPQSVNAKAKFIQPVCSRCNGLKSALIPTAACYKLVRTVRDIETKFPELRCNSIRLMHTNGIQATYYVCFKQEKIWFTWAVPTGVIEFGCKDVDTTVWTSIGQRAFKDIVVSHLAE